MSHRLQYFAEHSISCCCVSLQARILAEFDGDSPAALLPHLPTELPKKDNLEGHLPGVALPWGVEAPLTEDQLVDSLVGLPWEFIINKDARQEWARMDRPFRSASQITLSGGDSLDELSAQSHVNKAQTTLTSGVSAKLTQHMACSN